MTKGKKKKPKKNENSSQTRYHDDVVPRDWLGSRVYRFVRSIQYSNISQQAAAGGDTLGAFTFKLSDLGNTSEFVNLFDLFKIDYVEMHFRAQFNQQVITTGATITPLLYTILDYDDNAAPASILAMEDYQTCRVARFDKDVMRVCRPCVGLAGGDAVSATDGRFIRRGWCDCASPTIQYYGIKYGITKGASGQTNLGSWSVTARFFMSFKEVR